MIQYCNKDAEDSQIKKMQKDRIREMVKYIAKHITPNSIEDAFELTAKSMTYRFLMNEETGLWRRPKDDVVGMIQKEAARDIDSWVDIALQINKCREMFA